MPSSIDFADIAAAHQGYTTLNIHRPSSLNPWLDSSDKAAINAIKHRCKELRQKLIKVEDGVWSCASPWHAALFLTELQTQMFIEGKRSLFRGQRNSNWKITPSSARLSVENNNAALRHRGTLSAILNRLSLNHLSFGVTDGMVQLRLEIDDTGCEAIGQHYGIPSNLIDFTTDPNVATWFACHNSDMDGNGIASVFIIYYETAVENGLNVILAPPYAERLYNQRGLFIRSPRALNHDQLRIAEIRFPTRLHFKDRSLAPFVVQRGNKTVDLLADNTGLSQIVKTIQTNELQDELVFAARKAEVLFHVLRKRYPHPLRMWTTFFEEFRDMLDCLAMVIVGDQHYLDDERTRHVVESNKAVSTEIAKVAIIIADEGLRAFPELKDDWFKMARLGFLINSILGIKMRSGAAGEAR